MAEAETDIVVPPGEYAVAGLGRLLVIEGSAKLRTPRGPADLASLTARPADPTGPPDEGRSRVEVAPAGAARSPLVAVLLAILGLLGGAWLPEVLPSRPDKPTPEPPPAPAPVEPKKPERPDWLPALERVGDRLEGLGAKLDRIQADALSARAGKSAGSVAAAPARPAPVAEPQPAAQAPVATSGPVYYLPAGTPCPPGYVCVP